LVLTFISWYDFPFQMAVMPLWLTSCSYQYPVSQSHSASMQGPDLLKLNPNTHEPKQKRHALKMYTVLPDSATIIYTSAFIIWRLNQIRSYTHTHTHTLSELLLHIACEYCSSEKRRCFAKALIPLTSNRIWPLRLGAWPLSAAIPSSCLTCTLTIVLLSHTHSFHTRILRHLK